MYDFQNKVINKLLLIAAAFLGFVVITALLPGVVGTIMFVSFVWVVCGLIGWGIARVDGKVEDVEGVPFYQEASFWEYIVRGPVNLFKYFS